MADTLTLAFLGLQTLVVIVATIFAWINIRKFTDARAVDFIIGAESNIDPLFHSLVGAPPELVRSIYRSFDLSELTDADIQAFPFMYSIYAHVGRIHYMIANERTDLGLSPEERDEMLDAWLADLISFKSHPAMRAVHSSAVASRNFNWRFLDKASQIFRNPQ